MEGSYAPDVLPCHDFPPLIHNGDLRRLKKILPVIFVGAPDSVRGGEEVWQNHVNP